MLYFLGFVYNYDERGVNIDNDKQWSMCVAVKVLDIVKIGSVFTHWDRRLSEHSKRSEWDRDKYDSFKYWKFLEKNF